MGFDGAPRSLTPITRCCQKRWRSGRSTCSRSCCATIADRFEINRRFLDDVRKMFPGDEARITRMSSSRKRRRRQGAHGHLAISALTAPTAWPPSIQSCSRRRGARFRADVPERFSNKTNGVNARRWLLMANSPLARLITEAIGERLDHRPDAAEQARAAGPGQRFSAWASAMRSARPKRISCSGSRRPPARS